MNETAKARVRELAMRIVIVCVTLLACVLLLEAGLRIAGRTPTNMTDGFFVQFGDSYRLKPNLTKVTRWPGYSYTAYINQYGFRDLNAGPHSIEGKDYALFLGASQTFGNGVEFEDSFVGIMGSWLAGRGIDTLNLAIGGHHLIEQTMLMRDFVGNVSTNPTLVFLCMDPLMISKFDQLHEGIVVKGGYTFNENSWVLPYIRIMVANRSSAYNFLRDAVRRYQAVAAADAPGGDDDFYLGLYSSENPIHREDVVDALFDRLDEVVGYVRSLGAEPVILYIPTAASVTIREMAADADLDPQNFDPYYYADLMDRYAASRGVTFANPQGLLIESHNRGEELSFKLDAHFNGLTNRKVAEYFIESLSKDGLLGE